MLPKVENLTKQVVPIKRWKILPDGRVISPKGELLPELPGEIIYSPQATRLASNGVIKITMPQPKKAEPAPAPKVEEKPKEEPVVVTSASTEKPKGGKKPK
jgi:hypothetical protein